MQKQRWQLCRKGGTLRQVLVDANGLLQDGQISYSRWFVRDITRHLELEQEILDISERERRRLGQDLHDDLCQLLTGVEFLCQTLVADLSKRSKPNAAKAQEIAGMVRLAIVQTRELAHGLSPLSLEVEGLMVALQQLAARTANLFGRACRFTCPSPVLVPDQTVAVHVYRIAQEAVANALKHSQAETIEIELLRREQGLRLQVRDDGIGLAHSPVREKGMGLRIMKYRAEVLGGSLQVLGNPDGGTTVVCEIAEGQLALPEVTAI